MKNAFPNPIEGKQGKTTENRWDFRQPPYDQRSSCFVSAGTHEGIGHRNPVGHTGTVKQRVNTLPFGKVNVMDTSYVPPRQVDIEMKV